MMDLVVPITLAVDPDATIELEAEYKADTTDATATAGDILLGKTAYTATGKVAGMLEPYGMGAYMENARRLGSLSWAGASDEMLDAILSLSDAGEIDLYRDLGWRVGDTRTVRLSAMAAKYVDEAHAEQDVKLMLVHRGGYERSDGGKEVQFVWQMKGTFPSTENGYMNAYMSGLRGWDESARRAWCDDVFYNALPDCLRSHVKLVDVIAADGPGDTYATSQDYCFVPAEKEVYGATTNGSAVAEATLLLWDWYAESAQNRIKTNPDDDAAFWATRTMVAGNDRAFVYVHSGGARMNNGMNSRRSLAIAGCI